MILADDATLDARPRRVVQSRARPMTAPDSFDLLVRGLLGAITLPVAVLAIGGLASGEGFALWFGVGMGVSALGPGGLGGAEGPLGAGIACRSGWPR